MITNSDPISQSLKPVPPAVLIDRRHERVYLVKTTFMPGEDWQVNGAVLIGDGQTVVWDTFSRPSDIAQLSPLFPQTQPVFAVYSHADWDHCWGTCGFPFDHVVGHQHCLERFEQELPGTLREMNETSQNHWADVTLKPPDLTFADTMTLNLGGLTLELSHFRGHTIDSIVGFVPEVGLLLAGDTVEIVPVINDPQDVPLWVENLEDRIRRLSDQAAVLQGHGNLTDKSLLNSNLTYLRQLLAGIPPALESTGPFYQETHLNNCRTMRVSLGKF